MTPDQEKLLAAMAVLEDRIRDADMARHAIEARHREVVKSLAGPGRALTLTTEERQRLDVSLAELRRAEAESTAVRDAHHAMVGLIFKGGW